MYLLDGAAIASAKCGLVVKWLSRLPVTEEIAGSSPVGPAKQNASAQLGLFVCAALPAEPASSK
jgi:hypothetical protein